MEHRPPIERRTALAHALVWAAAAVAIACATARAQDRSAFSPEERRALIGGELVRRDLSRVEGASRLYGGASWQRVEAPIERVWALATDPASLTELIPSLDQARVLEERDRSRVVYMHHSFGVAETSYHVRMDLDDATHTLRFRLDRTRPHDIHEGRGYLALHRYREGTIVEWGMLVDPGGGMVAQIFGPMLDEWLLLPPRCVRDALGAGPTC